MEAPGNKRSRSPSDGGEGAPQSKKPSGKRASLKPRQIKRNKAVREGNVDGEEEYVRGIEEGDGDKTSMIKFAANDNTTETAQEGTQGKSPFMSPPEHEESAITHAQGRTPLPSSSAVAARGSSAGQEASTSTQQDSQHAAQMAELMKQLQLSDDKLQQAESELKQTKEDSLLKDDKLEQTESELKQTKADSVLKDDKLEQTEGELKQTKQELVLKNDELQRKERDLKTESKMASYFENEAHMWEKRYYEARENAKSMPKKLSQLKAELNDRARENKAQLSSLRQKDREIEALKRNVPVEQVPLRGDQYGEDGAWFWQPCGYTMARNDRAGYYAEDLAPTGMVQAGEYERRAGSSLTDQEMIAMLSNP